MGISILFFVFIVGISFGSFANVIILRLPRKQSILRPASYCYYCNKKIRWFDNIPIVSFIVLGGKCRWCNKRISFRYPCIELLTGLMFVFTYIHFKATPVSLLFFLIFNFFLLCIMVIDLEHYIIPDFFSVGMIIIGIVFSPWNTFIGSQHFLNIARSFGGCIAGGLLLLIVAVVTEKILKKETMGGGDIKLVAGIGAFLGWKGVFYSIFTASIIGSIVGFMLIMLKIKRKSDPIPFGPFLSIGSYITVFFYRQFDRLLMVYFY